MTAEIVAPEATLEANATMTAFGWWPDDKRAFPNTLARSALFTIGNRSDFRPRYLVAKPLKVHATSDMTFSFFGEELRQDDCDVYLQLIHLYRKLPADHLVQFTASDMLRALGWDDNAATYDRLRTCILRLTGSVVVIEIKQQQGKRTRKAGYGGHLIDEFKYKEEDNKTPLRFWQIKLNPKMVALFGNDEHTWLDWELRSSLRSPLAKKLHYFYASHKGNSYPISVEFLWQLSGSSTGFGDFKKKVQAAFDRLVEQGRLEKKDVNKVMGSAASGLQEFMRVLSETFTVWIERGIINEGEAAKIMAYSKAGVRLFKQTLSTALRELTDKGYLDSYEISKANMLSIKKNPSYPQQTNLL